MRWLVPMPELREQFNIRTANACIADQAGVTILCTARSGR